MRLKHLWVEDYKNLKDFSIDFEPSNGLTMIIGNNGSGKSNILELISGIFHDAYVDSKKIQIKTHYSLTYEIDGTEYQIKKQGNGRRYRKNDIEIPIEQFVSNNYLPSNIIALYSGEENRLWNDFYEMFYKKYIKRIEDNLPLENMNLVFINKYYWNIALLVILLSSNETLTPFINNELKLNKENVNVKIQFNKNNMHHVVENAVDELRVRINPRQHEEVSFSISDLHQAIYKDRRVDENGIETFEGNEKLDSEVFWAFTQAFMPKQSKVIKDISISFNGLTTTQLSEGEKKLILVKAVLEFLADEKTLVLMDEPDAHINEGRKQVLYDIFTEYPNRHIVLTTHSPTLMNIASNDNSLLLTKDSIGNATYIEGEKINALRHLTGSKFNAYLEKPILYCEGTSTSLEEKLYPILFPDYLVIPCGGHEEVISNVRLFNKTFADDSKYAIGIIDWDFKTEEQLQSYKNDNIYALKVLEIENVLMDVDLLNLMKERCLADDNAVEIVVEDVLQVCESNIEKQVTKHTSNYLVNKIKSTISPSSTDFECFTNKISEVCNIDVMKSIYMDRFTKMQRYITDKDYNNLYKVFDFEHNIRRFKVDKIVGNYQDKIIRLIDKDKTVKELIINKYFAEIPNA